MALKRCIRCKEEKTTANYIGVNNPILTGSLPICRQCIAKIIDTAANCVVEDGEIVAKKTWNVANKICQMADVPFIPAEWEKIYQAHGDEAMGVYISIFRGERYKTLDWSSYNDAYLKLEEINKVEEAIPELKEEEQERLIRKWGVGYDDEDLEYLENLHQGILTSQNVVGALNEDQALKICKLSLIIEEKIRSSQDFTKDLRAYDELLKSANFNAKNVKDANEFDSFGEVGAYLEKTGWVNPYYKGAIKDEVDQTMHNMQNFGRYLYTHETGVAEEINERIENLRIAAELEGEEFNKTDFENYTVDLDAIDQQEDFEVII